MVVLIIAWLLIQLVGVLGLSDPLGKLVKQVIAGLAIVVWLLSCFGAVHLPSCLVSFGR